LPLKKKINIEVGRCSCVNILQVNWTGMTSLVRELSPANNQSL